MNRSTSPANHSTRGSQAVRTVSFLAVLALCASTIPAQSLLNSEAQPAHSPARRIVVSFPDRKLALLEDDRVIKIYDVAVGTSATPSPAGEFQIVRRLENPGYYHPGVVVGPGKLNPLGPRWIGLNIKGFGIHGTNRPGSIGKYASHGCIRLRNRDIEDLFARVQVGDRVSLISVRTEEIARLFGEQPGLGEAGETLEAKNDAAAPREVEAHGNR
jgi:L,D-transpeptidase catalytic domain